LSWIRSGRSHVRQGLSNVRSGRRAETLAQATVSGRFATLGVPSGLDS